MEKEFVPYEQALALKELGFDELCLSAFFEDKIKRCDNVQNSKCDYLSAPLYQQAFRWFREKYNLHRRITYYDPIKAQELNHADYQGGIYASAVSWFDGSLYIPHDSYWKLENSPYDTYQEVELECLKKLIEIVKNK